MLSQIRHYVRTIGPDGGVEVCDGPAIGLDLGSLLEAGLPPWNVALQIFAGVCEILDIAEQDGQSHGDLRLKEVFVDDIGAVSIEGIGRPHERTSAPEGAPVGHATDLYALGRILFALLCDGPFPELPTHDPVAYEDALIDAVLLVDLDGLPEEIQGDVQWFLAKLLSFQPSDRPSALETWRSFIAFADALQGPDFVSWCSSAIDGGGERRKAGSPRQPSPPSDEELLGGPVKRSGPLTSAMSFGPTGPARGGATAFWTRDQMKAALEEADDTQEDDEDDEPFRPAVGGGSATGFWTPEQLAAMQEGRAEAPRPQRSSKRSQTLMMAVPRPSESEAPPAPAPPAPPSEAPAPPPPPVGLAPPVVEGPVAPGPKPPQPAAPPARNSRLLVFAALAAGALFLISCLGIGGLGAWLVLREAPAPAPEHRPATALPSLPDAGHQEGSAEAPPEAEAPSETEEPSGAAEASGSGAAPPPPPAPAKAPPKAPEKPAAPAPSRPSAAPSGAPALVHLSSSGRGSVSCAGGQYAFDGAPVQIVVHNYQLPATCLVELEGARGVFQIHRSGRIRCELSDGAVQCDPSAVK